MCASVLPGSLAVEGGLCGAEVVRTATSECVLLPYSWDYYYYYFELRKEGKDFDGEI